MSSQSQSAHRFQIQIIIFPEAVTFRKYLQAEIGSWPSCTRKPTGINSKVYLVFQHQ